MSNPETRNLNQATYTPVVNNPEVGNHIPGFAPQMPFLKQGILSTIFPDERVGKNILDAMGGNAASKRLKDAVEAMWSGDLSATHNVFADINTKEVLAFADLAIKTETAFLDEANENVEETIVSLTKKQPNINLSILEVRKEISAIKENILNQINKKITPIMAEEGVNLDTEIQPIFAKLYKNVDLIKGVQETPSIISQLEHKEVHIHLSDKFPQTVKYLSDHLYFDTLVPYAAFHELESTQLLVFTEQQRLFILGKIKMLRTLTELMNIEPIGYLHLERLRFTPIGYSLGELVYSLPMLPGETVRLTHREWSRTETEFTKLVATSLETASEEALSEKSELSQSFSNQQQHSSGFNASVSASGGFGPVSISASVGYNSQNAQASSREFSSLRSQEITKKAASRSKEEHKMSFQITTEHEIEDVSFREISNKTDKAVRWDFHRLMKKWQIDLFRYDVRLTYDIVIPEPGSYLLRKYRELQGLNDALASAPMAISITPSSINRRNWASLASRYGVTIEPPPAQNVSVSAQASQTFAQRTVGFAHLEIVLPEGYYFQNWNSTGTGIVTQDDNDPVGRINDKKAENNTRLNNGEKNSNRYLWAYSYDWSERDKAQEGSVLTITVTATGRLTDTALKQWQLQSFEILSDAARVQEESRRQRITRARDELQERLNREDSLFLRKLEKEEIMKGVLRWVLGPDFRFNSSESIEGDFGPYTRDPQEAKRQSHEATIKHGEMIRFLHQAIEWENVNYVLYPYFWTNEHTWDFKQCLYHKEFQHRSFLRAGAARVVLTLRPGFEKAFLSFMENGKLDELLANDHPYITVAQELKAMAKNNYPYTKDANEEKEENRVDTWFEFTPTGALDVREGKLID